MERIKQFLSKNRRYGIMVVVAAALVGLNFGLSALLQRNAELAERVFVPVAKAVSSVLRVVVNLLPFSFVELCVGLLLLLICLLVGALLWSGISFVWRKLRHHAEKEEEGEPEEEDGRSAFLRFLGTVGLTGAILLSYFNISYGFTFNRPEIDQLLGLQEESYSVDQLYELTALLAQRAGEAREALPEGANPASFDFDFNALRDASIEAFQKLQNGEDGALFSGFLTKPKRVLFSEGMSWLGISGMYAPFFSESSISDDGIQASIPYTITHELAHSVMFGREDEANFVAFLACINADDPMVRYSGYYRAYSYCANALYAADPDLYQKMRDEVPKEVLSDRMIESLHVSSYQGTSVEIAQKYNDAFIKSTGQEAGIESYGRVVDLFLAYYEQHGLE